MRNFFKTIEDYTWAVIIVGVLSLILINDLFDFILELVKK